MLLTVEGRGLPHAQQGEEGDEDDSKGLPLGVGSGGGAQRLLALCLRIGLGVAMWCVGEEGAR